MRLVNTKTIELEFFTDDDIPDYAILSHTWEQEEVLFHDMGHDAAKLKKGYAKLKNCCLIARENGFEYIWDDTCCIDKASSAELSDAINSMYRYYQEANVCYVYLADVSSESSISEISNSRWYTRGWTLQELIAPTEMIFFDKTWHELGTKASLVNVLSERTSIPAAILCDSDQLENTSIAQRMSWAADRVTTRKEDGAYSLMGIFGINMPLLYGEGDKAFYRLQEEIMRSSDDHSLFAWRSTTTRGGLLAPTPAAFKNSGNIIPWNPFAPYNSPFTITNKGVHMEAPLIAQDVTGRSLCVLCCTTMGTRDKLIAIHLRDPYLTMDHFERCITDQFEWIDLNTFNLIQYPTRPLCIKLQVQASARKSRQEKDGDKPPPYTMDLANTNLSLSEAAALGDEGRVWFLLAQMPVGLSETVFIEARLAISRAAREGHERLVSQLMTRRDTADLLVDEQGRTALSYAAEGGQESVIRSILSSDRIKPDARDTDGLSALWYAVYHGHRSCAKLLLQTGLVSGNVGGGGRSRSALWLATSAGDVELVSLLVQSGALHGITVGEPALYLAVTNKDITIAQVLLQGGANPDRHNSKRYTPLHRACRDQSYELVALLMQHGANPDISDPSGKTELAFATLRGDVELVKCMLEHGANPKTKCTNGKTAASYAQGKEMKSLLEGGQTWYKTLLDRTSTDRPSLGSRP
ncbi:ankyrin repeat-containing domain protein [Fusarium flagelliforme]|uniref:Uncharacterized protein n=1 Tax=Fusarium flagelliforme TaxID=2675880 RepID=A0A395N1Q2_9HYPO|nr:ankyrin repeat-containing domain protein [Fusarium flagelliforme]KAH7188048.1 ankyrin repeat-containing domain protein [Fusarium flagelliforme]RFN53890.1 hypothetical protein FIE12Z_1804 [Fusarium flagelliforme]